MHHKGTPHPAIGEPCNNRGVKTYAAAPNCYTANVSVFRKVSPQTFSILSTIISDFTPQQSRILMGLLKSAGSLEKHGLSFLEKVFFRLGEDYLDSYYSGYVFGSGLNHSLMIVGSSFLTGVKHPIIAHLEPSSVLSVEAFKRKHKFLVQHGKLYVPRKPHRNDVTTINYIPPTIETSREVLEALASKGKPKRKRTELEQAGVMEVDLSHYNTSSSRTSSRSSDDI